MQTFNIDISQPRGPLVLYASQGDSLSRFFSVTVTDNGAAYEPPAGAIYTVRFGAPGKPAGWYDTITEVGGGTHPAVVVDENTFTVEIAEQALGTPGENALVLIVSDATGYTLASWAFVLQVAAVPGYDAPEATVYYNALSEQVAQVLASATAAATSAILAESWAVGGTGTRPGEDTNNSQYWAQQAQSIAVGQLGWYETEQALQAAHPTGENGQWAIVGSTDTIWTWDSDTSAWVNSGAQVDLSNYYTKTQADAAFATTAQGALAASAVQSVNGKTGTAVTLDPQDVGGFSTYTCTTSGTTHALTGTGNNIKFVADAAFEAGDTITVNGQAVTAQTQDGAALSGGAWASGATVVCWLNGAALTVSGSGNGGRQIPQNAVLFSVSKTLSQQQTSESVRSPSLVIAEGSFTKQNEETALRISASAILNGSNFVFGLAVYIDDNFYLISRSNIQEFLYHSGSLVIDGVSAGEHRFSFVAYGSGNSNTTMTITTAPYQIASIDCMEVASVQ